MFTVPLPEEPEESNLVTMEGENVVSDVALGDGNDVEDIAQGDVEDIDQGDAADIDQGEGQEVAQEALAHSQSIDSGMTEEKRKCGNCWK